MPKVVDPSQRREQIFEALFDVVIEAGLEQASLRRVADAAGLAIGSVRHYFVSHDELISSAAKEVIDRISARLERHRERLTEAADRLAVAEDMLSELLPLNANTSRETTVWLEITVAARINPALREPAKELLGGSRTLAGICIRRMGISPRQAEIETERLAALIDGLALRTTRVDGLQPETARAVIRHHLEQLRSRLPKNR